MAGVRLPCHLHWLDDSLRTDIDGRNHHTRYNKSACVVSLAMLQLGRRINVFHVDPSSGDDARTFAYTRLRLFNKEEATILAWSLLPPRSNKRWWKNSESFKVFEESPMDYSLLRVEMCNIKECKCPEEKKGWSPISSVH